MEIINVIDKRDGSIQPIYKERFNPLFHDLIENDKSSTEQVENVAPKKKATRKSKAVTAVNVANPSEETKS